jgi:hypothetical protein
MLLVIVGVIVKWGQSTDSKHMDQMQTDLDGIGTKINRIDAGCIEQTTKLDELKSRMDRNDLVVQGLATVDGEFKAKLDELARQSSGLQRDMTSLITESSARIMESIGNLKVDLARLQAAKEERDNTILPMMENLMKAAMSRRPENS